MTGGGERFLIHKGHCFTQSSDLCLLASGCLKRQLCFKNNPETVLQCYFYYDIQTLSLQRTDIALNHYRCMYRNDIRYLSAQAIQDGRKICLKLRYSLI